MRGRQQKSLPLGLPAYLETFVWLNDGGWETTKVEDLTDTIVNLVSIFCYSQKTVYKGAGEVSDLPAVAAGDPGASSSNIMGGDGEERWLSS